MYFHRLKDCRDDRDLKQKEIASVLGIDQREYSRYELGVHKIPINHLIKLALFYGTSIDYLVGLTNAFNPYERIKKPILL